MALMRPERTTPERRFRGAVVLLLGYLCCVQIGAALAESITADEPVEFGAGYSYLTTGDFRMNIEHPAFFKMLTALPLLKFHLMLADNREVWRCAEEFGYGTNWLGMNSGKADKMLFAGRLMAIFSRSAWVSRS